MNKISKLNFEGQQIYVGMDVHKHSWSTSIFTDKFEHKTFTQPPEVGTLFNYLKRNFPGGSYKSVYEAGYSNCDCPRGVDDVLFFTGNHRWSIL